MKRTPLKRKTPLKRTSGLKPVSDRRRKVNAKTQPICNEMIQEIGECMLCGYKDVSDPKFGVEVHEIYNGYGREKCRGKRYGCLVLCWPCNSESMTDKRIWPVARQLALLKAKAPHWYNLSAWSRMVGPGVFRVTSEDVEKYL